LVVAHTHRPRPLLKALGAKTDAAGRWQLILPGEVRLGCRVRALLLRCSTDWAWGARGRSPASFPAALITDADVFFGRRGDGTRPALWGALRLTAFGVALKLRLQGGWAETANQLLDAPAPLPAPPAGSLAGAYLRVASGQLGRVVSLLPKRWQKVQVDRTPLPALAKLAGASPSALWLLVDSGGWRGSVRLHSPTLLPAGPQHYATSAGIRVFAQLHGEWLVVGSSADRVTSVPASPTARGAPGAGLPPALGPLLAQPVSGALWLPVTDPLEWLPAHRRASLIAATMGMPEGDRKVVALTRALLTLAGELGVVVRPISQGIAVDAQLYSPAYGPATARLAFAKAWGEKWRRGGFYRAQTLAGLARVDAAVGRLARALRAGPLQRPWAGWLALTLTEQLERLRVPEVDCARLAQRLAACEEAFGRQLEPARWRELDTVVLWDFRQRERRHLLARARQSARALGARCDGLGGRLGNAPALSRCLSKAQCAPFVACVMAAFRAAPAAP
jgi:hypothetical protein